MAGQRVPTACVAKAGRSLMQPGGMILRGEQPPERQLAEG